MTTEASALAVIDEALRQHPRTIHVFGMFSGGDDSLTATLIASKHPRFTAAVHINTGIGIEETREFVRSTCTAQGWPLLQYRAKEDAGQDYEAMVTEHGFPGPAAHYQMYRRLKERCIRILTRQHKKERTDRIMLVTGCRSQESVRRMGHVEPMQREGARVWVNPIHDWSKRDCLDYIEAHSVPRNPVVEFMHMSGECLCGAYAHPGEIDEIALWYPKTAARIRELEAKVKAAGHPACVWGQRPPKGSHAKGKRDSAGRIADKMPLCQGCLFDVANV